MNLKVTFSESSQSFSPAFEESQQSFKALVGEVIDLSEGEKQAAYQAGYVDATVKVQAVEDAFLQGTMSGDYVNDRITETGIYALYGCTSITGLDLPNVTEVKKYSLYGLTSLTKLNLPKATILAEYCLCNANKMTVMDFPAVTEIKNRAFDRCAKLKTLILRASSVCTLIAYPAFTDTPFEPGGSGGRVLVPAALVETYQQATQWKTLYAAGTCVFIPLEEYTKDGTTTGEIDWDKLNE